MQLNVRPYSRAGLLRYKIAPKCSLSGPFCHSGVGRNPGVAGPVRSYNLVFTYPCQGGGAGVVPPAAALPGPRLVPGPPGPGPPAGGAGEPRAILYLPDQAPAIGRRDHGRAGRGGAGRPQGLPVGAGRRVPQGVPAGGRRRPGADRGGAGAGGAGSRQETGSTTRCWCGRRSPASPSTPSSR